MMAKKNKSDSYQYKIVEIPIDPSLLGEFSNNEGLGGFLHISSHSEEHDELKKQLLVEVYRLISTKLTIRQAEVVYMFLEGKTQMEIAKALGVHQTSVHKCLKGNIDYTNGKKRYGGAIKKLRKLCTGDEAIGSILKRMQECKF